MPAPHWFFRFMYDRESAAWERRRDEPEHRELVERIVDELANVVAPPGPVADLGCGPGAHALALARRGYDVVGVDGSPRMVEVARTRAARDEVDATFDVHDVERAAPLRGRVARRCPRDPRTTAPPASRGLHRRHPPLPPAGRAPVDHRSRPRPHAAHVPEPVLAAARSVLPPRARRRPLLRHERPSSSCRGPGPDRRRVQRRARSRERVGTRMNVARRGPPSSTCRRRRCSSSATRSIGTSRPGGALARHAAPAARGGVQVDRAREAARGERSHRMGPSPAFPS